jgi:tRNA-dihydrouridine synthase B
MEGVNPLNLQIGPLQVRPALALAPMAGVTNHAFRLLAKEQGCNLLFSEMISAKGLIHDNQRNRSLIYFTEAEKPIGLQLFGSEPAILALAAEKLEKLGANFIDLNLGCPTRKITRNMEGGALLRQPERCSEIFKALVEAVGCPVTVKLRKGWDDQSYTLPEIALRAAEAGISMITVHGRTVEQGYSGQADWDAIKEVKKLVSIPVIGNGDVDSAPAAAAMIDYCSCDGVMVGRAARGNPWIFREILALFEGRPLPEKPSLAEITAMVIKHYQLLSELKGEAAAAREMRRHSSWYIKGLPGSAAARQKLIHASSLAEVEGVLTGLAGGEQNQ